MIPLPIVLAVATPPAQEAARIDALIAAVESLKGVRFVRNGKDYSPAEAASHLRLKRSRAGARIKTAEDFITYCGSSSSQSGQPYLLRFPGGRETPCGDWLRAELGRAGKSS